MLRLFIPGNGMPLPSPQHIEGTIVRHFFDQRIADRLRRLRQSQTSSSQGPLQRNAPSQLPGLLEDEHAPCRGHGGHETVEAWPEPGTSFKCRLCGRILSPFKTSPTHAREAGILLRLDQRMGGDNTLVGFAERTCIQIHALKLHIL